LAQALRAGALIAGSLALVALTGCMGLIDTGTTFEPFRIPDPVDVPPSGDPGAPADTPNVAAALGLEAFPLVEGATWSYRNATADHLPIRHPTREMAYHIREEAAVVDGYECFALEIDWGDAPTETVYLHRAEEAIYEIARDIEGETTIYAAPLPRYRRPLVTGATWSYARGGETTTVRVLFQETVIAPESDAVIFPGAWKLEIVTGPQTVYEWLVEGIGMIKRVLEGEAYEITTYDI